ncbi:MAG: HD domain-containing protein [Dehalococcoidia bacterium]|nr:HD domain-containing protein [Dehalococcoidia bacterium]
MGNQSTSRLFLIFVGSTLLALLAIGASIAVFHSIGIRAQAEEDAARTATRAISPLLEREAGELGGSDLSALSDELGGVVGGNLQAVRVWTSNGDLLAAAGETRGGQPDRNALADAAQGDTVAFKTDAPSGDVLASYAPLGASAVVEVQQAYGPIASSVASSQRELLMFIIVGGVALALALPGILWAAIRDLKGEYDRLLYLYRTGQAMRSTLELTDVLEQLARDAAVFTHSQLALATLVEEESDDLIVEASYDFQADSTAQHHRKVEEWFMRRCAGTGETVLAEQDSLPYMTLLGYEPTLHGAVQVLCAPIRGRERVIGVLTLARSRAQGRFGAAAVHVVEEMTAQGAMAVEQAVLFAKVRRYADEIEVSYDTTLKVLTAALDTKDASTHGHSERVARLTVALAKEVGVPKERLLDIERGALLHDVGKIGVPDEVLGKPAELDEGEWEAMQKHPLLAGLLVSKVGFLEGALPILLYHHERYDGTGYPFRLEGKAIPLEARIFSVVDSYDAMTSDRPYRKAMPPEAALAEIRRNSGIQFDPEVVDSFTRVMARQRPALKRAS